MASYWYKADWLPEDLDRSDPYLPRYHTHAIPPGIYCEDEAARAALMRGASKSMSTAGMDLARAGFGYSLAGTPVYVATPAQLAVLKAMPAKSPEEARAEQEAAAAKAWSMLAEMGWAGGGLPQNRASRPAPPVPGPRHPFNRANRAQRRAMAAAERRRA